MFPRRELPSTRHPVIRRRIPPSRKALPEQAEGTSWAGRRHMLTRPLRAVAPPAQCRRAHPPVLFIGQSENSSAILWKFKNYSLSLPTTSVSLNRLLLSDILEKDVYERYLRRENLANSRPEETQPERSLRVYCTLFALMLSSINISRRGLSRVAYPGQGNARALTWDE
jgi:hypothetical protein